MIKMKIKEAIVVEGRDDTAAVRKAVDGLIIETHGFGIKKETWELIKSYLDSLDFKILVLHDIEYMFSEELGNLDVIYNFKYYSRNGHIIVLFINAKLIGTNLIYSEEGCPDYRNMDVSEVDLVGWE